MAAFAGFATPSKPSGFSTAGFATPASGFAGFGAASTAGGGFSLAGAAASSGMPAFSGFGTPASSAATGFTLGASSSGGFSLAGAATSSASGFSLGGASSASGFTLGASSSGGFSLGGFSTAASSGGFSLGGSSAATGFSLGASSAGGFSLAGSSTGFSLAGSSAGGFSLAGSTAASAAGATAPITTNPKEAPLEPHVKLAVKNLEQHVAEQKKHSHFVDRHKVMDAERMEHVIADLRQKVRGIGSEVQTTEDVVTALWEQSRDQMRDAELCERFQEPGALTDPYYGHSQVSPITEYYLKLVQRFERDMQSYRQHIKDLERALKPSQNSGAQMHDAAALQDILMHQSEAFIDLSAQLQNVHEKIRDEMDHYRKVYAARRGADQPEDPFSVPREKKLIMNMEDEEEETRFGFAPTPYAAMMQQQQQQLAQAQQMQGTPFGAYGMQMGFGGSPYTSRSAFGAPYGAGSGISPFGQALGGTNTFGQPMMLGPVPRSKNKKY